MMKVYLTDGTEILVFGTVKLADTGNFIAEGSAVIPFNSVQKVCEMFEENKNETE